MKEKNTNKWRRVWWRADNIISWAVCPETHIFEWKHRFWSVVICKCLKVRQDGKWVEWFKKKKEKKKKNNNYWAVDVAAAGTSSKLISYSYTLWLIIQFYVITVLKIMNNNELVGFQSFMTRFDVPTRSKVCHCSPPLTLNEFVMKWWQLLKYANDDSKWWENGKIKCKLSADYAAALL